MFPSASLLALAGTLLLTVADKVPAASRTQLEAGLGATRSSWKQMASNSATKNGLEAACKQASDIAKQSMSAYGCTF